MTSKIISSSKQVEIPSKRNDIVELRKERVNLSKLNKTSGQRDITQLSPPYDLKMLRLIGESSTILTQCIDSYAQNIAGFGLGVRPKVTIKVEDKENHLLELETEQLEALLTSLNEERPAKEVMTEAIRHVEECGNAFLEVIRDGTGNVVGLENIEPEYITVTKLNRIKQEDGTIKKFRYFIFRDVVNDSDRENGIYFKSFGDSTPINTDGTMSEENGGSATELIHLKIGDESKPYGIPRYIGALVGILGDRKANELNYRYFTEGRHVPLAIILENAQLTAASEDTLKQYANSIGGESSQHKFILLEAEKVTAGESMLQENEKDKAAIRLEKLADILQKDALFLEYSDKVTHDVLSAFRLPPVYVGMSNDYNRSTVETAKELTEEQVFQPRRDGYEWRLNNLFKEYGFELVEVFLQSPDYSNTEDMKNILEPAIQAGAVAPNDLRGLVAKVINSPLEPFDKEDYNYPLKQNGVSSGASISLSKAYGETSDGQLASILRQAIAKEGE